MSQAGNQTRHFTATGFVVHGDATLLHWHARVNAWLPPGGHVEPNEDPVQAVLREIHEETGLTVDLVPTQPEPSISTISQIAPPRTILIEDVYDDKVGAHQHIDLVYYCAVAGPLLDTPDGWIWFAREDLATARQVANPSGDLAAPPEDVIALGIEAIDHASIAVPRRHT